MPRKMCKKGMITCKCWKNIHCDFTQLLLVNKSWCNYQNLILIILFFHTFFFYLSYLFLYLARQVGTYSYGASHIIKYIYHANANVNYFIWYAFINSDKLSLHLAPHRRVFCLIFTYCSVLNLLPARLSLATAFGLLIYEVLLIILGHGT